MTRICITGGPRTGKTTLAATLVEQGHVDHHAMMREAIKHRPYAAHVSPTVRHTDAVMDLGWSEASQAAALWLDAPGPWIIEGVAVSRALRNWRDRHPGEPPPVDRVIRLTTPHVALLKGQAAMAKGEDHVWRDDVEPWLRECGVHIQDGAEPWVEHNAG